MALAENAIVVDNLYSPLNTDEFEKNRTWKLEKKASKWKLYEYFGYGLMLVS